MRLLIPLALIALLLPLATNEEAFTRRGEWEIEPVPELRAAAAAAAKRHDPDDAPATRPATTQPASSRRPAAPPDYE